MDWILIELVTDNGKFVYKLTNMSMTSVYDVITEDAVTVKDIEYHILNMINAHISVRDNLYLVTDIDRNVPSNSMEILQMRLDDTIHNRCFMIIMKSLSKTDAIIHKYYTRLMYNIQSE